MGKPKKSPREKDLTSRYFSGGFEEDDIDQAEEFKARSKTLQQDKMAKTAAMRAEGASAADIDTLPLGEVVQVFSLFSEVLHEGKTYLCVVRRTLSKLAETFVVVGDRVRFRTMIVNEPMKDRPPSVDPSQPEGVIEAILPRRTILTRADSFKGITQSPIIANAEQVLIVASIRQPYVKWGLIDRVLVAALAGGLKPIVCLNKLDLVVDTAKDKKAAEDLAEANAVLEHYKTLDVRVLRTSVELNLGLDELREALKNHVTVLAGHSGVGKSSLVRAIQPSLDLKVGAVSRYTDKGRHTTTSARRYPLEVGGVVVDTPGVKQFGLWGVTRENLEDFFPDMAAGTAPAWRKQSFERILEGLPKEAH